MAIKKDAEKVAAEVRAETNRLDAKIKVELKQVEHGLHTVFTGSVVVKFQNGVAEVDNEIAKELKKLGLIK